MAILKLAVAFGASKFCCVFRQSNGEISIRYVRIFSSGARLGDVELIKWNITLNTLRTQKDMLIPSSL